MSYLLNRSFTLCPIWKCCHNVFLLQLWFSLMGCLCFIYIVFFNPAGQSTKIVLLRCNVKVGDCIYEITFFSLG